MDDIFSGGDGNNSDNGNTDGFGNDTLSTQGLD